VGLYRFRPPASGRMGILWTLSTIRNAALVEFGSMGHMVYARVALERMGVSGACGLYATHLNENDIALGSTDRLLEAVRNVIQKDAPQAVFLLPSSVPQIIGTDLGALARELGGLYPEVPVIAFGKGGFHEDACHGVEEALAVLAKELALAPEQEWGYAAVQRAEPGTFNIIGSCADRFRFRAEADELERLMWGAFGMKPQCVMTAGASVEDLRSLGAASLNLAVREEAVAAAGWLKENHGTPYVLGCPYGIEGTTRWLVQVGEAIGRKPDAGFISRESAEARQASRQLVPAIRYRKGKARLFLGGPAESVAGIGAFAREELDMAVEAAWRDSPYGNSSTLPFYTERQWMEAAKAAEGAILMASGQTLQWAGQPDTLQIANPDLAWRINPYAPPFAGYRGAMHLMELWANEINRDS
jgi:nitrogenase molybdenum-cofactor synthesis protein NifE